MFLFKNGSNELRKNKNRIAMKKVDIAFEKLYLNLQYVASNFTV